MKCRPNCVPIQRYGEWARHMALFSEEYTYLAWELNLTYNQKLTTGGFEEHVWFQKTQLTKSACELSLIMPAAKAIDS